jgi:hypothetical protein
METFAGSLLIILQDYNAIAETIASTVVVIHGIDLKNILKSFDAITASTVENALSKLKSDTTVKKDGGAFKL